MRLWWRWVPLQSRLTPSGSLGFDVGADAEGNDSRDLVESLFPSPHRVFRHADLLRELRLRQAELEPQAPQLAALQSVVTLSRGE